MTTRVITDMDDTMRSYIANNDGDVNRALKNVISDLFAYSDALNVDLENAWTYAAHERDRELVFNGNTGLNRILLQEIGAHISHSDFHQWYIRLSDGTKIHQGLNVTKFHRVFMREHYHLDKPVTQDSIYRWAYLSQHE